MMSEVIYGGMEYAEAIEFLRKKANVTTAAWDDMLGAAHINAFTVAGALKKQLLSDLRVAVDLAIKNGTSITEFRKNFDTIISEHGWNYHGKRGWRTRIIYDTNMRTAAAAGKWHKIQETKKTRPYLKYLTAGDDRVREQHSAWEGVTLKADDPFWDTHYPPNGWNCRCTVRTLNKTEAKKQGISKRPKQNLTKRTNKKTGATISNTDAGIDTGWDYNVGQKFLAAGKK